MKNIKIFAFAACLITMAACNKETGFVIPGGHDASKPAVESLSYDEATSGAKAVGLTWTADRAIAAGATSFTIQLTNDISFDDVKNATKYDVVDAPATSYIFNNLNTNDFFYARVRANYDGFYYSDWTYLGSKNDPLAVCVGTGAVAAKFGTPTGLSATVTDQSLKASWDAVAFADSYTFEYKPASSGEWSVVSELKTTVYEVEGLIPQTAYDIRVKAHQGETASDYATASVTTKEPSKFNPEMGDADAFMEFLSKEAAAAATGAEFSLLADIDLSGKTVPTVENFKGNLDGKGHAIKGLKSGSPLFNTLTGTVKNIVIDASCQFTPTATFFGIIAGNNQGTISGITNKAAVSFSTDAVVEPMLVAAIAGQSSGEISGCTNEGAVSVNVNGATVTIGTAGIVGYQAGPVINCENKGAISFVCKSISAKVALLDATGTLPSTGGISAVGAPGFSIDGCNNRGKIVHSITNADEGLTANLNRNQIGGVSGSPCGSISNTNNYGEVNVNVKNSTPGAALGFEFIVCVGGIGGGDYLFTNTGEGPFSNTSYINCVNEGNIIVDSDASKSNSAIGGIVGWPGQEKPVTGTSVNGCTNKGSLTGKGVMKCRIGGVEGGTGVIENSTNEGIITLESGDPNSVIGSLCAFHSQGHAITGCSAKGEVISKVAVGATGGIGGLIGNIGNAAHDTATGCVVNCKITTSGPAPDNSGMVVGYFNGTSQAIVLGSASDPIQVSGSLNGASASA
ncbi:MAG: fibronectin type III domain-containing protein, partial [Bacteroidales bacterium]|nr:fibronectin type III domain-containing protein [Bacteroidales bacterium]